MLLPAQFLPIAERFRLTPAIDREIFERACAWLGIDYAQGHAVSEPFPLEQLLPHAPTLATRDGDAIIEQRARRQSPRNIR